MNESKYICEKARSLPMGECYMNHNWQPAGMAMISVSRIHKSGNFTIGFFLVDTLALGLKDSFFRFNITPFEYKNFINGMIEKSEEMMACKLEITDYTIVHNIIYGAIAFAEEYGFKPCKEFAITQYILEEDTEDIELIELEFGKDGKPFLIY